MVDRYKEIKRIIDDWFSLRLKLNIADVMPYLVFLYEENIKLAELINREQNQQKY